MCHQNQHIDAESLQKTSQMKMILNLHKPSMIWSLLLHCRSDKNTIKNYATNRMNDKIKMETNFLGPEATEVYKCISHKTANAKKNSALGPSPIAQPSPFLASHLPTSSGENTVPLSQGEATLPNSPVTLYFQLCIFNGS